MLRVIEHKAIIIAHILLDKTLISLELTINRPITDQLCRLSFLFRDAGNLCSKQDLQGNFWWTKYFGYLLVCLFCISHLIIFHSYEKPPLPMKGYKFWSILAIMAIEHWGFSSVSHVLWHGTSVYYGHLRGPVTLIMLPSVRYLSCHYLFLRLMSVAINLPHARRTLSQLGHRGGEQIIKKTMIFNIVKTKC